MNDIRGYSLEELRALFKEMGLPAYRAGQIFAWIYKRGAFSFAEMSDLPQGLRDRLKDSFSFSRTGLLALREAQDGTKKLLFELCDGNTLESVLIPARGRNTACLSTQVGCKFACSFCASGMFGFKRNLEINEIIGQVQEITSELKGKRLSHIVFMGMGEPLDNYENLLKAVRIINSKEGFTIAARRITVSTSGVIPGIKRLAKEGLQIELSVSLHSADDKIRSILMPINRKYPLAELIKACRDYAQVTKRQVTFEYALIRGVNSSLADAEALSRAISAFDSKVNLILYNSVEEFSYQPPDKKEIEVFKGLIEKRGIPVTIRKSRGQDIAGACGQLRAQQAKEL